MWFKKCFYIECLVFSILAVEADSIAHNESYRKNLGSELIKNITEVNKTLKDLIKNYKYLENIYKTDEKLQSDSSGSEIDEKFKQMKRKRKEQKRSQKEGVTTASLSTMYQGTAYIFESRTSDELQSKDIKEENEKEDLETDQNKGIKMEELSPDEKKSGSESSKEEEEISEDIEEIEIDIPKTPSKIKPQKDKNVFGKKTRFNVLHDGQEGNVTKRNKSDNLKVGNQRIVYSEQFTPQTFWKDIVNRPIKLNRVMSAEEIAALKDDYEDKTRALSGNTKKNDKENLKNQSSNNTTDDSPLRSYGDACLEMPIEKCKKALKTVNKNVCKMRFKCKSEFKSDFIENSKRGCEKNYMYNVEDSAETTTITTTKNNDYPDLNFNGDADEADGDEDNNRRRHRDNKLKSRDKHLRPSTEKQSVTTFRNDKKSSSHPSLRDKYEKECQKELRAKCVGAGNYAVKKTCTKHECEEKKEKALIKACKKECKNAFAIDKKSSGSSDDGSESDSDSDE